MAAPAWRLAIPLGGFFALFFLAPLALLLLTSAQADRQMTGGIGLGQYAAFFADPLNLSTLGATLLVGLKATLLCLVAGYPLAYLSVHAPPRLRSLLLFVVVLPIVTSVVVRTFAWIVILGRNGLGQRGGDGAGPVRDAAAAAVQRDGRRDRPGAGADAADGAAADDDAAADRPEPVQRIRGAGRRRLAHLRPRGAAAEPAGRSWPARSSPTPPASPPSSPSR